MDSAKDRINVCVRIKPFSGPKPSVDIISESPAVLVVPERSQTYQFDKIFGEESDQAFVYDNAVKPFVEFIKEGYSCSVFTYGQTGTGKTHTMGSAIQTCLDPGIIPRALDQMFELEFQDQNVEIEMSVSFLEIYNEKVFDLLQPSRAPLLVSGFIVQGLTKKNVKNARDAKNLLEEGNNNRHVGETKQNSGSSRSHAVFTVHYTMRNSMQEITGKLNLVDLAGSESARKTGSQGSTFHEGVNINKGLLSIGQVISAIAMKSKYIPYRQSMITSILQGSLNTENYISLIACISANPDDVTETLQTLEFAKRAKMIRCSPKVGQVVAKYRKDNPFSFGSGKTPLKKGSSTPDKTPMIKRACLFTLPSINESTQSQISNGSQFSIDTSSQEQNFSPVIRKYMEKMEVKLMNHLEAVVQNTLRRSRRQSLGAGGETEKENTPKIHWSKIQGKVSQMVKSEITQLTSIRATSSPIHTEDKLTAGRRLNYESPDDHNENLLVMTKSPRTNDFPFKVPELPKSNNGSNKRSKKLSPQVSPIETEVPKTAPRRSLRLSMKSVDFLDVSNSIDNMSFESQRIHKTLGRMRTPQRRSTRLLMKNMPLDHNDDSVIDRKKITEKSNTAKTKKDSPFTTNTKRVLRILNQGSQREVERLHTVGSKTAEQILLYRKLRGSFNSVDTLAKLPGWGIRRLQSFLTANFLNKD